VTEGSDGLIPVADLIGKALRILAEVTLERIC
jgi:hypothetical protein